MAAVPSVEGSERSDMAADFTPPDGGRDAFSYDVIEETQTPETDISSSDHDPEALNPSVPRARAKKQRKSAQTTKSPVRSLRPAKDILSRIRHDPALEESDYIVGYLDRHLPHPVEINVSEWKGGNGSDFTEEDWIPQHRILYFRKADEPKDQRVWDREKRLDRLFGSGVLEKDDASDKTKKKGKTK